MSENDDSPILKGSIFPEDLVRRQIDRCNRSATDESLFQRNVEILLLNIPKQKIDRVKERNNEYIETTTRLIFKKVCGIEMGTKEHPLKNVYGDIISPREEEEEIVDYNELFRVILEEIQDTGLSWSSEIEMVDGGRIEDDDTVFGKTPTPYTTEELREMKKEKIRKARERRESRAAQIQRDKLGDDSGEAADVDGPVKDLPENEGAAEAEENKDDKDEDKDEEDEDFDDEEDMEDDKV